MCESSPNFIQDQKEFCKNLNNFHGLLNEIGIEASVHCDRADINKYISEKSIC